MSLKFSAPMPFLALLRIGHSFAFGNPDQAGQSKQGHSAFGGDWRRLPVRRHLRAGFVIAASWMGSSDLCSMSG
jgi:hypothetical protein